MIERIHIKNFKSIYDLDINVGRVNLFIGENGSGKSNLLEALVFVSASQSNKLDNEFLVSRGIRITEPVFMRSAFDEENRDKNIEIYIGNKNKLEHYEFKNDTEEYSPWINIMYDKSVISLHDTIKKEFIKKLKEEKKFKLITDNKLDNFVEELIAFEMKESSEIVKELFYNGIFKNFIIYSPENTALRTFEKEGQIQPLGINGEGLLKLLKVVNNYEDKSYINTIIESLQLFDWFEDIKISDEFSFGEQKLTIKDKYLYKEIDQRSTNEGFLFILFYITLIVAKETPKSFAIDNIDASLNPKLCTKLMTIICD